MWWWYHLRYKYISGASTIVSLFSNELCLASGNCEMNFRRLNVKNGTNHTFNLMFHYIRFILRHDPWSTVHRLRYDITEVTVITMFISSINLCAMSAIGHINIYFSFVRSLANRVICKWIFSSAEKNPHFTRALTIRSNAKIQNISITIIYSFFKTRKIERKKQLKLHKNNIQK